MDLYRQYLKERENAELLEYDWGFATYKFQLDHVYLQDIYVVPERRSAGLGVHLMNEVAALGRSNGYKLMLGSVDDGGLGSETMHQIMEHLNFKKWSKEDNVTYYIKEI